MKPADIPEEILEQFGYYDDELEGIDDKIEVLAETSGGFLMRFNKIEEVPESDDPLADDYMSQTLEHSEDQDHYLRRYSGNVGEHPYLIATVHSSYDEAIDISSTHRGIAWFGRESGSAPDQDARFRIKTFVEDTIHDDLVWKLNLITKGVEHIHDTQKRTALVRDMANIIRRLSQ